MGEPEVLYTGIYIVAMNSYCLNTSIQEWLLLIHNICGSWYQVKDIRALARQKKYMCVFPISRPTHHFLADRLRFLYCATQSFVIGDHMEKKSKSDHFGRSYEVLKTKFSKISANIDTCLKYLKRNLTLVQNKIFHPFFAYRLGFFLLCDSKIFFIEDHICKKICL